MNINLWGFLSIAVIFSVLFAMFVIYLGHKKTMKQLEIKASKSNSGKFEVEKPKA